MKGTKKDVDMWKIRSSIARKFSDYIDDSKNLTKPSRGSSLVNVSEISTSRESKYFSTRRLSKYSYEGSKQKLNSSVQWLGHLGWEEDDSSRKIQEEQELKSKLILFHIFLNKSVSAFDYQIVIFTKKKAKLNL